MQGEEEINGKENIDGREGDEEIHGTLQENSGILTDILTENEILGISRGISEETPRKHKIGFPRKKPMNSEEIL